MWFWAWSAPIKGGNIINTRSLGARLTDARSVWIATIAIPLLLLAPAFCNGYPLLQWDTGGYLARWYEGYLVPSRSTVFGIYLHVGETSDFWLNLGIQTLATLWILQLTLRVLGLARPVRLIAISLALIATTALPWLDSMLLTDIFAGLSVLALFILILHGERISTLEKAVLFAFIAFSAATHSATLAVLLGLCCVGWMLRPWLGRRIPVAGLVQGSLTTVAGAAMLLAANFALSGQLAWTPGGYGVAFGRMLQDGIVAQYLHDHCATEKLKLCPYRDELPPTADDFLWGHSMFNTLGRFKGLNDEMGYIVLRSLAEYPEWQAKAALTATADQLMHVATGEGSNGWIPHTYGIIERYIPRQVAPMRAGAAATLAPRLHRDQPHPRAGRAGLDAPGRDPVRPRPVAAAARRSDAAGGHGHARLARQCLRLRRDLGAARPLRRAHGVGRDLRGADRGRARLRQG
ncbi:hypothetical protein ABIF05_003614 [Bradyrhizobium elkanii]